MKSNTLGIQISALEGTWPGRYSNTTKSWVTFRLATFSHFNHHPDERKPNTKLHPPTVAFAKESNTQAGLEGKREKKETDLSLIERLID